MKKNKLTIGLVTSFIGALALTSCKSTPVVTSKDNSIIEFVGYNGESYINVNTDEFYSKYAASNEGVKLYYDAILEALIRHGYGKLSEKGALNLKKIETLKSEAEEKVESSKQTARENANTNDTSYDEEWDKILESHSCESEDDLYEYYLFNLEKDELTDKYFKSEESSLIDKYLGINSSWDEVGEQQDVTSLFPYHILHVLVSLSASESDYVRGTITEAEANKLWTVVRKLIDGSYSFEDVASTESDDTGSKAKFGDVGIMTTKTSFYNEFKLGLYAYDAILSGVNGENRAADPHKSVQIYKAFGLNSDAKVVVETTSDATPVKSEKVTTLVQSEMVDNLTRAEMWNDDLSGKVDQTQIPEVPYQVFKLISDKAKDEKIGGQSIEASATAYPRNVLYNQFLNFHSPFVITDRDIDVAKITFKTEKIPTVQHDFVNGDLKIAKPNFVNMTINGEEKGVLCDANGSVIVGVRSSAGIHFMSMRKSPFYNTNKASHDSASSTLADQKLQDYYTTAIPGEAGYPASGQTYVNMKKTTDMSYYKERANEVKNAVKSSDFDAAFDYRIYDYLLKDAGIKVVFFDDNNGNSAVKTRINDYIELLRATSKSSGSSSINEAWQTYLLMLKNQNDTRKMKGAMVPTTCAFNFNNVEEYKKGETLADRGYCYVK